MSDCERHQETLSAFLDGETSPAEALPALDHLLRCPACRDFYGKARALQRRLAATHPESAEPAAPAEVWERIVADASGSPARRGSLAVLRSWAPRLAAALMLGLAAWSGYALGGGEGPEVLGLARQATANQVEIEVGAGGMTDSRFLDLTLEILRADRRYHDKLLEVLTAVDAGERAGGSRRESDAVLSSEEDRRRDERREPGFTTANL